MIIDNDADALSLAAQAYGTSRASDRGVSERQAEIRQVARQFEALLMHSLLKSMRATTPQDGLLDNDQTRLYTSLLDQEIAQMVAKRGLGLAEILERQLSRLEGTPAEGKQGVQPWRALHGTMPELLNSWDGVAAPNLMSDFAAEARLNLQRREAAAPANRTEPANQTGPVNATAPAANGAEPAAQHGTSGPPHVHQFIEAMRPHATVAARHSGIPARFLIGHAALESGWGRYEIMRGDGETSHNLFGIKADANWSGDVAEVMTTEYVGGVPVKRVEQFRAYQSYQAAFIDYAEFLSSNPRYSGALQATGDAREFAYELQSAGYATDPQYADKLSAVINHRLLRDTVWT